MHYCRVCKKQTTNPKFCSRSCAATFNNKGVRRHGNDPGICIICKKSKGPNNKKYCSVSCYNSDKIDYSPIILNNENVSWKILKRYIHETQNICSTCGIGKEWNGRPLTLQCDHIDGDASNNVINNVRLLCPNCHSQTETYGSKNQKNPNGKEYRQKRLRYHR